jgi:methylglutaconyl-CoA hydratase
MAGTEGDADPVLASVDRRGVATVTLNRPRVNNAYDGGLIDGLIATFGELAARPGLRCVVLEGAGRHFQAGADLAFLARLHDGPAHENHEFSRRTVAAIRALQHFPHPTVALVQGGCFGGGIGIAAACDIAIAAEDAIFALSEVRWGITPAPIVPLLVERLGPRVLGRLALTGARFDAAEARRIGLVHELCAPDALAATGARIVEDLLLAGPEAVALTKALVAEALAAPLGDAFAARIVEAAATCRRTAEAEEGLKSFAEKRKPAWYPVG